MAGTTKHPLQFPLLLEHPCAVCRLPVTDEAAHVNSGECEATQQNWLRGAEAAIDGLLRAFLRGSLPGSLSSWRQEAAARKAVFWHILQHSRRTERAHALCETRIARLEHEVCSSFDRTAALAINARLHELWALHMQRPLLPLWEPGGLPTALQ